jgi:hypothetical protein
MSIVHILTRRPAAGKHPAPSVNGTAHVNGNGHGTGRRTIVRVRSRSNLPANLVATDSEWDTTLPGDAWLSTAFATPAGAHVVCVRADLPPAVRERLVAAARRLGVRLLFVRRTDGTDLLALALPHLGLDRLRGGPIDLAFFFSPKDVEFALGWSQFHKALHKGAVRQRHALTGRVELVRLRDLCGWAGKMSLAGFAAALGIETPDKGAMDKYKANMRRGLEENPEDFLRYAVADARVLLTMFSRFVAFVRQTQRDALGMKDGLLWDPDTIPMTLGRLVAETFQRWLIGRAGKHGDALRVGIRKLGFLDPDARDYQQARKVRGLLLDRVRTIEDLDALAADTNGSMLLKNLLHSRYLFTALDGCGVRWWSSRATTETSGFNALVHGGRCHNERPDAYCCGPGLDVDVVGCYGASLRSLVFPVGLPSVWSFEASERRPTLGEWLSCHEEQLIPGLWTCTVSGPLPFEQDLLYSKIVTGNGRRRADPDGPDLATDFALLRRELHHAIITADLLAALRAVATSNEWAALKRLEVITAATYLKKNRRANVAEWCASVLASPIERFRARLDDGTAQDRRPRWWYGVPLEDFVGRLADERQHLKARQKATDNADEKRRLDGLGTVLKLIVNTLYGDFASRHFAIGNTVIANNITARARLGVWLLAKALGLRQSITDGGIYTPAAVPHWQHHRPGLDTLSRMGAWDAPRFGRTLEPLAGLGHWDPDIPLPKDADAAALAHVRGFWAPYGLKFPFDLAHKTENAFRRAAYWGKADYFLLRVDNTIEPKVRGKNKRKRYHPTFALLEAILAGKDDFPTDLGYRHGGLLKVATYLRAKSSATGYANVKDLRPGDDIPETEHQARYNNAHFPLADLADFLSRQRRKKVRRGLPTLWFERYGARGIANVHARMTANKLRVACRLRVAHPLRGLVRKAPPNGRG